MDLWHLTGDIHYSGGTEALFGIFRRQGWSTWYIYERLHLIFQVQSYKEAFAYFDWNKSGTIPIKVWGHSNHLYSQRNLKVCLEICSGAPVCDEKSWTESNWCWGKRLLLWNWKEELSLRIVKISSGSWYDQQDRRWVGSSQLWRLPDGEINIFWNVWNYGISI